MVKGAKGGGEGFRLSMEDIEADPLVKKMVERMGSKATRHVYVTGVLHCCRFVKMMPTGLLELYQRDPEALYKKLTAWLDDLNSRASVSAVKNWQLGVKTLLKTAILRKDRKKYRAFKELWSDLVEYRTGLISGRPAPLDGKEHVFTHGELSLALSKCKDNRERVLLTLLVSSGVRIGTICDAYDRKSKEWVKGLCLGDIEDFTNEERHYYRLNVRKGEGRKVTQPYYTWITAECRDFIKDYMAERKSRGDTIGPDSRLIVTEDFRGTHGHTGPIEKFRPMKNVGAVRRMFTAIFKRLDMLEVIETPGKSGKSAGIRYNIHPHSIRYHFKSTCKTRQIDDRLSEFWMGHSKNKQNMNERYDISPRNPEYNEAEYGKVVEAFTLGRNGRVTREAATQALTEVQALKASYERQIEALKQAHKKETEGIWRSLTELQAKFKDMGYPSIRFETDPKKSHLARPVSRGELEDRQDMEEKLERQRAISSAAVKILLDLAEKANYEVDPKTRKVIDEALGPGYLELKKRIPRKKPGK